MNCKRLIFFTLILAIGLPGETLFSQGRRNVKKSNVIKIDTPKTSTEAKQLQEAAKREIRQTEAQIEDNEKKVKNSLTELGKLEGEIKQTQASINSLNSKLNKLQTEISSLEGGISSNEHQLSKLRSEYLKAVKKMRVTKKNKNNVVFIFSSKSFNEAMRRMRYLKEFSEWRNHQTDEINEKLLDLKKQKEALGKAQKEQSEALAQQKFNQKRLQNQHTQQEMLVNELKLNGASLQRHLKKKQQEATELGNLVSLLIAEEQKKAEEAELKRIAEEEAKRKTLEEERRIKNQDEAELALETKSSKNPTPKETSSKKTDKGKQSEEYAAARKRKPRGEKNAIEDRKEKIADNFGDMRGSLITPTTGSFKVTSRFGRQFMESLPDVEYDNPGIDAETDAGAYARSVFKGKVSGVYLLPGYNTVVIVNHGNYYTVYGNIETPTVKIGDVVAAGVQLGKLVQNEEDPKHSSIHFEVWKNREKLNPLDWLR